MYMVHLSELSRILLFHFQPKLCQNNNLQSFLLIFNKQQLCPIKYSLFFFAQPFLYGTSNVQCNRQI
jgi:hypothetical protein